MLSLLIYFHIYRIRRNLLLLLLKKFFLSLTIEVELMYNHMIENLLMEHSFHNELLVVVVVVEAFDIVLDN